MGLTCVSQELGGFQNLLRVNAGLIVVHLRSDHVHDSGSAASDGTGSAVQSVHVLLLQRDHALVYVLQDMVLCDENIT